MQNNQENWTSQCSVVIHEDINDAENMKSMPCPLCRTRLKLYQIHFDEKFLMCGNVECTYPFGVSDYHIYKIECNEELVKNSKKSSNVSATSGSTISQSDWSELDKMLTNIRSPCSPNDTPPPSLIENPHHLKTLENVKQLKNKEDKLFQSVQQIKELNIKLFEADEVLDSISNEKWLKHIAMMQERSGIQLLKKNELQRVKKKEITIGPGEIQIDIDSMKKEIKFELKVNEETELL